MLLGIGQLACDSAKYELLVDAAPSQVDLKEKVRWSNSKKESENEAQVLATARTCSGRMGVHVTRNSSTWPPSR